MASARNIASLALDGEPSENTRIAAPTAPTAGLQETLRQAVEKGLAESRAAYSRVKEAADEATIALETSVTNATSGLIDFNTKALDALRANFDASIDFAKAAINIKTIGEFVSLNSDHVSKQAEALTAQAKEFHALAQKVAVETAAPIKNQVARIFGLSV